MMAGEREASVGKTRLDGRRHERAWLRLYKLQNDTCGYPQLAVQCSGHEPHAATKARVWLL